MIWTLACWSAGAYAQASALPPSSELSGSAEASGTEPTFAASANKPAAEPASAESGIAPVAEPTFAAFRSEPTFAALRAEPTFAARPLAARAQSPVARSAQPGTPPTPDDICRTIEQSAAENGLPVEFFARVIWQESRFNALAVSNKGAQGIAQFMPRTAGARGLIDPFDPIEALHHSAAYLHELMEQFGNLGLAAAAYNAGPGRVRQWLHDYGDPRGKQIDMVDWIEAIPFTETRLYVQRVLESVQIYRGQNTGNTAAFSLAADLAR